MTDVEIVKEPAEKNETNWEELLRFAELMKSAMMFALALYLTVAWFGFVLRAQDKTSINELSRRVEVVEQQNAAVRLAVLESVSQQHSNQLNNIEALLWKSLIGIAALVGETVWQYIMRARKEKA